MEVTDGRDQNGDDDMNAIDDRQAVTIMVTNVNEAPVVSGDDSTVIPGRLQRRHRGDLHRRRPGAGHPHLVREPLATLQLLDLGAAASCTSVRLPNFEVQTSYLVVTITATDDDEDANLSGSLSN